MKHLNAPGLVSLFAALLLAACAPMAPLAQSSPQDIERVAREYAAVAIEDWGLVKGSPREAKLQRQALQVLSNESFQAAAKNKPPAESWNEWGARLANEGSWYLTDEALRRYFSAKARMLNDASDAECVAFVEVAAAATPRSFGAALRQLGKNAAAQRAVWRQRLARISEEDFDTITQTEIDATLARARRIGEPPAVLSPAEEERGFMSLERTSPTVFSSQKMDELTKALTSNESMAACSFARMLLTAKSRAAGPDASLGLRVFTNSNQ